MAKYFDIFTLQTRKRSASTPDDEGGETMNGQKILSSHKKLRDHSNDNSHDGGSFLLQNKKLIETSSATAVSAGKPTDTKQNVTVQRKFQKAWLNEFQWLTYNSDTMTCKYCSSFSKFAGKSEFATGSTHYKRETLVKHSKSFKHLSCRDMFVNSQSKPMPISKSFSKQQSDASEKTRNDLCVKMNTAYTVAKEEFPFTKFRALLLLQKKNGIDVSYTYANDTKCAEMIGTIAAEMKKDIQNDVEKCNYLSIMFDGATDCSVKEVESIIVRYVKDGTAVNKLLGLSELKHATADGILDAISDQFRQIEREDFKEDLISFCADGATVNQGKSGGVKGKLTVTNPWLIGIWCLPHRLELAVMEMLKTHVLASDVVSVLGYLYKTYHYSCKSRRELRVIGEELGLTTRNPTRATGTRWTPHLQKALSLLLLPPKNAVDSTTPGQYVALLNHSEHLAVTSKNSEVQGRSVFVTKRLVSFQFTAFCHFLLDLLTLIATLSLQLQSNKTILPDAIRYISFCLSAIENLQMRAIPKGHMECFLKDVATQQEAKEPVTFQGVTLKNCPEDITDSELTSLPLAFVAKLRDAANATATGLGKRFGALLGSTASTERDAAARTVACFRVFNPDMWPDELSNLTEFGEVEVEHITDWFRSRLERNGCKPDAILHQWTAFKLLVRKEFMDKTFTGLCTLVMTKEPYLTDFKDFLHLLEILLVLPVSSSSCERIFSTQKRIKSDNRSSLHVSTVEDLIRISSEGPCLDDFVPQPAIIRWLETSKRLRRPHYTGWPNAIAASVDKELESD